jgi:hypothetical protein
LFVALVGAIFGSCKESNFQLDVPSAPPSVDEIEYTVYNDDEDANTIHFEFTGKEGVSPLWTYQTSPGGATATSAKRSFTQRFLTGGKYEGTIQAFNSAGTSEAIAFDFTIPEGVDPRIALLTGGDTPKTWVWDITTPGHLGEGDLAANTPNWWPVAAGELDEHDIYDDELCFGEDGSYELQANGFVYVESQAVSAMGGQAEGKKPQVVAYTQPKGQTWAFQQTGDKLYIVFSQNAFPSYLCNSWALTNPTYEVLEISENKLSLRFANQDIDAWYFNFIPKGSTTSDPEPEPEPDYGDNVRKLKLDSDAISGLPQDVPTDFDWTWGDTFTYELTHPRTVTATDGSQWTYTLTPHLPGEPYLILYSYNFGSSILTPQVPGRISKVWVECRTEASATDPSLVINLFDSAWKVKVGSQQIASTTDFTVLEYIVGEQYNYTQLLITDDGDAYNVVKSIEIEYIGD